MTSLRTTSVDPTWSTSSGVLVDFDDPRRPKVAPSRVRPQRDATTVPTTTIDSASGWLEDALRRVDRLRSMPLNWDAGGAASPNTRSIGQASEVIVQLARMNLRPAFIDPSTDEGVCVSFRSGNRYADIECFNSGDILAATSLDDGETEVWNVPRHDLGETLRRIQRFIEG